MQQIYKRTPMPKCDFNKAALQLYLFNLFIFFYIYNLHFFEQKIYSHQVLIYLNVPGIPVKRPLQNRHR